MDTLHDYLIFLNIEVLNSRVNGDRLMCLRNRTFTVAVPSQFNGNVVFKKMDAERVHLLDRISGLEYFFSRSWSPGVLLVRAEERREDLVAMHAALDEVEKVADPKIDLLKEHIEVRVEDNPDREKRVADMHSLKLKSGFFEVCK
jgi:hypothetical protein